MDEKEKIRTAMRMIALVRCALNGETPSQQFVQRLDPEKLFQVCEAHILTACAAYALESAGIHDKRFTEAKYKAIRKNILLDAERQRVLNRLEDEGIWYLPLKGAILHNWYPQPGMRQMCDNDILYDPDARERIREIMLGLGFTNDRFGISHNDAYFKPPVCNFEMHHELFLAIDHKQTVRYYADVKSRLRRDAGRRYAYSFRPEDFYIYVTAHEYKHFSKGGTGVRSLADTYVILRKYENIYDWDYIRAELKKLGLTEFEAENRLLAQKLFTGGDLNAEDKRRLRYYILSGTYGIHAHRVSNRMQEANQSKLRYLAKRLFPDSGFIKEFYPFFYRHKALVPLLWVYRPVHALAAKRNLVIPELKLLFRENRNQKQ
ncbi:MAG: nucleotidyltransferase family protein [Oscillospiraceae bacterium]|nr:nucleotidyltransferase family protein [Oscillospiraceae bacterium]